MPRIRQSDPLAERMVRDIYAQTVCLGGRKRVRKQNHGIIGTVAILLFAAAIVVFAQGMIR